MGPRTTRILDASAMGYRGDFIPFLYCIKWLLHRVVGMGSPQASASNLKCSLEPFAPASHRLLRPVFPRGLSASAALYEMFGFEAISQKIHSCFLVKGSLCIAHPAASHRLCQWEGPEAPSGWDGWQADPGFVFGFVFSAKPCEKRCQRASAGCCWAYVAAGLLL